MRWRFWKRQELANANIQVGNINHLESWATYWTPDMTIEIHGDREKADANTQFCYSIIGLDHEYLHHILYNLEGIDTCRKFDNLVSNIEDHCRFLHMNFFFEGITSNFWN